MPAEAYTANGTIRVARFVKGDSAKDHHVLEADANDRIFGISQHGGRDAPIPTNTTDPVEAAQADEQINIFQDGDSCMLEIGTGGCTRFDLLQSDADGKGVTLTETAGTKAECGCRALESASAGEFARVKVKTMVVTTET